MFSIKKDIEHKPVVNPKTLSSTPKPFTRKGIISVNTPPPSRPPLIPDFLRQTGQSHPKTLNVKDKDSDKKDDKNKSCEELYKPKPPDSVTIEVGVLIGSVKAFNDETSSLELSNPTPMWMYQFEGVGKVQGNEEIGAKQKQIECEQQREQQKIVHEIMSTQPMPVSAPEIVSPQKTIIIERVAPIPVPKKQPTSSTPKPFTRKGIISVNTPPPSRPPLIPDFLRKTGPTHTTPVVNPRKPTVRIEVSSNKGFYIGVKIPFGGTNWRH